MWQIRGIPVGGGCRGCGVGCGGTGVDGSAAESSSIGFPVWVGVPFAAAYRGRDMWTMWWLAAACFGVAAFVFLCVLATRYHSRWYREQARLSPRGWIELRVIGQHVANRSWVHNLGPQQKSTFLPWTGVLKGGMGSLRGVLLGHLARTRMLGLPGQFGVAEDSTWWAAGLVGVGLVAAEILSCGIVG